MRSGLTAKQVGRMAGVELPVSPIQHHHLVTETIPEIAALDFEVPMMIDLEGYTYMRQELQGVLVGVYERDYRHWNMAGAPWDCGLELIPQDVDRISSELSFAMSRYPVLEHTGISRWVNGAFTLSPDGNPLVGPVPGLGNYWFACAVMAGNRPLTLRPERRGDANRRPSRSGRWGRAMTPGGSRVRVLRRFPARGTSSQGCTDTAV